MVENEGVVLTEFLVSGSDIFTTIINPDRIISIGDVVRQQVQVVTYPSDIYGPIYEERIGKCYANYALKKLLQNRSEDDFKPFCVNDMSGATTWNMSVRLFTEELPTS